MAGLEPGRRLGPGREEASAWEPAGAAAVSAAWSAPRPGRPHRTAVGEPQARSPAQHDGPGAAAAGAAVPAGAAPAPGPTLAPGWGRGREGAAVPEEEQQPPASPPPSVARAATAAAAHTGAAAFGPRWGGAGAPKGPRGGLGRARVTHRPGAQRARLGEGLGLWPHVWSEWGGVSGCGAPAVLLPLPPHPESPQV